MLAGATALITRFNPKVGAIQSWDLWQGSTWMFPVIVDKMNLELLMWAAKAANEPHYREIAISHADTGCDRRRHRRCAPAGLGTQGVRPCDVAGGAGRLAAAGDGPRRQGPALSLLAVQPLVMLASILDLQSLTLDQLVRFTLQGIADPSAIEKATGIAQENVKGTPSWKIAHDRHTGGASPAAAAAGSKAPWEPGLGGDIAIATPLEHIAR